MSKRQARILGNLGDDFVIITPREGSRDFRYTYSGFAIIMMAVLKCELGR